MFVRSRRVWFGFAEKMFTFSLAKSRKRFFFLSEDDCHILHSFTNFGLSLRLLEKTWQQLFLWVFPVSVGLFGDNKRAYFFAIELIIINLFCKQTLKTENTLHKLDIFRHRPISGLFPLRSQSLRQTFQRIIQAVLFAKHLHCFCRFVGLSAARTKLNSKKKKKK